MPVKTPKQEKQKAVSLRMPESLYEKLLQEIVQTTKDSGGIKPSFTRIVLELLVESLGRRGEGRIL